MLKMDVNCRGFAGDETIRSDLFHLEIDIFCRGFTGSRSGYCRERIIEIDIICMGFYKQPCDFPDQYFSCKWT